MSLKTRDDLSMAYTPGVARVSPGDPAGPEGGLVADDQGFDGRHRLGRHRRSRTGRHRPGSRHAGDGRQGDALQGIRRNQRVPHLPGARKTSTPLSTRWPPSRQASAASTSKTSRRRDASRSRRRLKARLDIPVFHDDQHGTAVVMLAALHNACKLLKRPIDTLKVVVSGVGAAGMACTKILRRAGVRHIIGFDTAGALYRGRTEHMNPSKQQFAAMTNPSNYRGDLAGALKGANLFLGLSGPDTIDPTWLKGMARRAMVFAMANPTPEVTPESVPANVSIIATGRSDYPNQINNVLCFPGIFKGRAVRPCARDQRVDEAGGGQGHCVRRQTRRTLGRVHHSERVRSARGSRRREGRGEGGRSDRRGATRAEVVDRTDRRCLNDPFCEHAAQQRMEAGPSGWSAAFVIGGRAEHNPALRHIDRRGPMKRREFLVGTAAGAAALAGLSNSSWAQGGQAPAAPGTWGARPRTAGRARPGRSGAAFRPNGWRACR